MPTPKPPPPKRRDPGGIEAHPDVFGDGKTPELDAESLDQRVARLAAIAGVQPGTPEYKAFRKSIIRGEVSKGGILGKINEESSPELAGIVDPNSDAMDVNVQAAEDALPPRPVMEASGSAAPPPPMPQTFPPSGPPRVPNDERKRVLQQMLAQRLAGRQGP